MATISDALSQSGNAPEVENTVIEVVRFLQEECCEFAHYDICEKLILDWFKVMKMTREKSGKVSFRKKTKTGFLTLHEALPVYLPSGVDDAQVSELLYKFLWVRSHSYRIKNSWDRATEGWVLWRVLTDMLRRKEAQYKIKKNKLQLTLAPTYLAEVRMLASMDGKFPPNS